MIIKKGYYVVNQATMQIVSSRIATPEAAKNVWEDARRATTGSAKFFIMWVPTDNFAWGESPSE